MVTVAFRPPSWQRDGVDENPDLRALLQSWPFDPENSARIVRAADGREIMQIRTPLGIEQYELDSRPDGHRPHDTESALAYQRQRLSAAEATGQGAAFRLSAKECAELFDEGVLYYYRYLHLFQLKDWPRVVRDTERNLGLFELVHHHAKRAEDREHLEQWRPYILRMHAVARAMIEWEADHHAAALKVVRAALQQIEGLPDVEENETFQFERRRSLEALRELAQQVEKTQPLSEMEMLERQLHTAVETQEFERAATLRDRIRNLRPVAHTFPVAPHGVAPIFSALAFSDVPSWRNWQTRGTQNPVPARACGFNSLRRHHSSSD